MKRLEDYAWEKFGEGIEFYWASFVSTTGDLFVAKERFSPVINRIRGKNGARLLILIEIETGTTLPICLFYLNHRIFLRSACLSITFSDVGVS